MLKNTAEYEKDTSWAKLTTISCQTSPVTLPVVSVGYCQRDLADKLGKIRPQMGTHNGSVMVSVLGTPCAILTLKSKSQHLFPSQ